MVFHCFARKLRFLSICFAWKLPSIQRKGGLTLTFPSSYNQCNKKYLDLRAELSSMESSDHEEETKRASMRVAFTQLDQVASDFALAIALQEQERAFTILFPTFFQTTNDELESDETDNSEDEDEDEDEDDDESSDFFTEHEMEEGLEFLEGEGSNRDEEEEMGDDEIDPDELSYEELIALGEIVGEESRGLSMEEISMALRPYTYHSLGTKTGVDRCVICQVEYEEEEKLVALPCQHHPYHQDCIIKWLQIKKTCPICSTEVSSFL